ncbi:MAG TPA: hypothetical protein VGC10_06810 [Sphingomonas sp.]
MRIRFGRGLLVLAVIAGTPAGAQLFFKSPDYRGLPVTGDEPAILIPLPGATQPEKDANVVWTLRAGLNVAALQCNFAGSVMARTNYNDILGHHGKELGAAYRTLGGYFRRKAPKRASAASVAVAMDQYVTRTYNSFSTLNAQLGFCQTAGAIGEQALMSPKGALLKVARTRLREFRNSLVPVNDAMAVNSATAVDPAAVPSLPAGCFDRNGNIKKKCA